MKSKKDAIVEWVAHEFSAIPQEWVHIILEHEHQCEPLPMWGWMWRVDDFIGCKLWGNSRVMCADVDELSANLKNNPGDYTDAERADLEKAIKYNWPMLEQYIDEEMSGARCILNESGYTTAAYIYVIADEYVIGINGAGWNFYDGVWDRLYDVCGIRWHEYVHA